MNVTKITIGRLYNLGSYEHIRYDLTVELNDSESPSVAILGMEKILEALNPKTSTRTRDELDREQYQLDEMNALLKGKGEDEFKSRHGYSFKGTPEEYIGRCEKSHSENVAKRDAWEARSAKARQMLEDLGGAAAWKDAKLDWENDDNDF